MSASLTQLFRFWYEGSLLSGTQGKYHDHDEIDIFNTPQSCASKGGETGRISVIHLYLA